jgi:hypothetical protein
VPQSSQEIELGRLWEGPKRPRELGVCRSLGRHATTLVGTARPHPNRPAPSPMAKLLLTLDQAKIRFTGARKAAYSADRPVRVRTMTGSPPRRSWP